LFESAEEMLEQLRDRIASGDGDAVAASAHSLKGMATELGVLRLRAAAIGLESEREPAGWSGHLDRAKAAIAELRVHA